MVKGGLLLGTVTVTSAIVIIIGWITLVEYDNYPEDERKQLLEKIKRSPLAILLISLMPIGILINLVGTYIGSLWLVMLGASLILLQGIIISFLFWKRKRWKSVLLLVVIIGLGTFLDLPLITH